MIYSMRLPDVVKKHDKTVSFYQFTRWKKIYVLTVCKQPQALEKKNSFDVHKALVLRMSYHFSPFNMFFIYKNKHNLHITLVSQ